MNPPLTQIESPTPQAQENLATGFARRNALRRLVRCLFAEKILDKRTLTFAPDGRSACLALWSRHAFLFFHDLRQGPADTFVNQGNIVLVEANGRRTAVEQPAQLIDLLAESFDFAPSEQGLAGLKRDIANSIANDALARSYRGGWSAHLDKLVRSSGAKGLVDYLRSNSSVKDAAMLLEQWGSLEGHPFYPTWKSKPDLSPTEVVALSPEFDARVRVRLAALRADMAHMERMPHVHSYHGWFAENFPQQWIDWKSHLNARGLDEKQWLPLPIHSWHLENYVRKEYAAEVEEGVLLLDGPDLQTLPTMSFRTMLPQLPGCAPFIKLPVAMWLTSEQRSLQAKSIHMGPRISTVIRDILQAEKRFGGLLEIFPEEVAFHYRHAVKQEDRPGRHLSVAFRASREAFERTDGLLPVTVAALFNAAPGGAKALVTELVDNGVQPASPQGVEDWFRQYARVVTRPVIAIYLLYGIGLEAHQQNTSVLFCDQGRPKGILIRDFGDGRTFAPLLSQRGHELKPYVHPGILPTVFTEDIAPVRCFVLDACFVCHLHELALLLTHEYRLPGARLWEVLREETQAAFDAVADRVTPELWQAERAAFMEKPWPTRSVLRMHLGQYADYRLQHDLPNPLAQAAAEG